MKQTDVGLFQKGKIMDNIFYTIVYDNGETESCITTAARMAEFFGFDGDEASVKHVTAIVRETR